jgi:hypothetical protein
MRIAMLLALLALPACATLPEAPGGEQGLPSAGAGPFRALVSGELGNNRSAPNGLSDSRGYARDISVLDVDGQPDTFDVIGFVGVAVKVGDVSPGPTTPTASIVRYTAADGRSFDRKGTTVLTPDAAWEGGVMGGPAALRVGEEIRLYYAAAGGIGLARGDAQGMTFTREAAPVLGPAAGGWEAGATPRSPGVVQLGDGSFRLFYEVPLPGGGSAIGEARSTDGIAFQRLGDGPALAPGQGGGGGADGGDPPVDGAAVGGPFPMRATSGTGEPILRVYYGAVDGAGKRTVGLAARYGDDAPLQRAVAPVFGTSKPLQPGEPCVVVWRDFALLYVTEDASTSDDAPAVAVGLAPATAALPSPTTAP